MIGWAKELPETQRKQVVDLTDSQIDSVTGAVHGKVCLIRLHRWVIPHRSTDSRTTDELWLRSDAPDPACEVRPCKDTSSIPQRRSEHQRDLRRPPLSCAA